MTTRMHRPLYSITGGRVGHPDHELLADCARATRGDTDLSEKHGVRAHLEECAECRVDVEFMRGASAVARALAAPPVSEALLERVLARRANGAEHLIGILSETQVTRRRPTSVLGVAVALAVAAVVALFVAVPREGEAGAADGRLELSVPFAITNEVVRVTYTPSTELARHDSLVLRGQLRSVTDAPYGRVAEPYRRMAILRRDPSGRFVGSFRYPESIVHAALVVEDADASIVDDHGKKRWELLLSDSATRRVPSFDALAQRSSAHMGRSWEVAFEATKEAVRRYPDRWEGWTTLLFFQQNLLGERATDSLRRIHLPRLHAIDARLREAKDLPATKMNSLYFYAMALKDSATAEYWRRRL
ncbi:MAG: hypothetical protein ABI601_17125, partial [bacterium]